MDLPVEQHGLFAIPAWTIDLTAALADARDEMVAGALRAIDEQRLDAPYEQSRAVLAEEMSGPWPRYRQLVEQVAAA
ncbi:MAG TPA: hypothetical protein VHK88_16325, partial [Aquihabitans sp.]|nr:hypothetical protein [Aquihabitans sp.]